MLVVVIILGFLIVAALGALITGIIMQPSKSDAQKAQPPVAAAKPPPGKAVSMSLAPGYKILNSETQPGRLILHVRSDTQDEIDIIDLEDGHVVARVHATAPQ
jgi:hypothetical protein